jgi:hypothetical protein
MMRPALIIAWGLLTACTPAAGTPDPRSAALAGTWCMVMDGDAPGKCATLALVAVRRDAEPALGEGRLLAEGVISLFEPVRGERLPDGTPVYARTARGDSIMLDLASERGDYHVYLAGLLRGDTLKGRWRSTVGRSSGLQGAFVMNRLR